MILEGGVYNLLSSTQGPRTKLATARLPVHGGNVWDATSEFSIRTGKLIDFSSNMSPVGPPRKVLRTIKDNLWKLGYYPQVDSFNLRSLIAKKHKGLTSENVIVGNGSCELIYLFADVFAQKGTTALIPEPTFSEYESAVRRTGGKVRGVMPKDNFNLDVKAIMDLASDCNIVMICNPNNPTGTLIERRDLLKIIDHAKDRDSWVLIDEAFMDFIGNQKDYSLAREVRRHNNLFVLRSLTKFYSLAGLRIGYGLGSSRIIEALHSAKVPWNVNCLAQVAAEAALKDPKHAARVREHLLKERSFMMRRLKTIPRLRVHDSKTNFILINTRETGLTGKQISERSLKRGMMIRDCSSFRGLDEFYIRISMKTRKQNMILLDFLRSL